jgi:hypothetical protein
MRRKTGAEGCGVIGNVLGYCRDALGVVLSRLRIVGVRDDLGGCLLVKIHVKIGEAIVEE